MPLDQQSPGPTPVRPVPAWRANWSWPKFSRNALLITATIALSAYVADASILPNLFPKRFGVVDQGRLYRSGNLTPAATAKVVRAHNIRTIVDLGAYAPGSPEEARAQATADALGVTRHRFPLFGDGTGDPNAYVHALRIATDPAHQPVLIHCAAGSERTGCAVALYRVLEHGITPDAAYDETRAFDHDPRRNPRLKPMFDTWREPIFSALSSGHTIPYDGASKD
jgi:protein tyrosine/serine phosphatase